MIIVCGSPGPPSKKYGAMPTSVFSLGIVWCVLVVPGHSVMCNEKNQTEVQNSEDWKKKEGVLLWGLVPGSPML